MMLQLFTLKLFQGTQVKPNTTGVTTPFPDTIREPHPPCPPPFCLGRKGTLGDGICDRDLNIEDCRYDGGRAENDPELVREILLTHSTVKHFFGSKSLIVAF